MRLNIWVAGLATVLLGILVQTQAKCVELCVLNRHTCDKVYPDFRLTYAAEKKKGKCTYEYGEDKYPNSNMKTCCQTEEDYPKFLKMIKANDLLGDLTGAEFGEYPHQVKLQGEKGACGGTIYNKDWIITAAHCIQHNGTTATTRKGGYIIAGQTDVDQTEDEDKYYFQDIIVHHWWNQYDPMNGSDIALLHLNRSLTFVKGKIQPLKVESRDFEPQYGGKALVMGFGMASEYGAANHLQEAEVPIHEPSKAARLSFDPINAAGNGGVSPLNEHLAVAGDDSGFTVGQGDSGGPIICPDEQGKPVLCGVASFKLCQLLKVCRRPSYFLRIAPFLDWIGEKTNQVTQPRKWLVDEPMHPQKVPKKQIPGYLVRLTSFKKSCMGTMIKVDRFITSHQCITEMIGNDSSDIFAKVHIYHFKSGKQLEFNGVAVGHEAFQGNVSSKIYEYLQRALGINDAYMIAVKNKVGPDDVLQLPPSGYSISSPAVEYTMNEKSFSVETRRYLPMDRELCQKKVHALDKKLQLHSSHLCMRRVYSAERECDRDVGGPLVAEGKYFVGMKTFHGCGLSAFPEIFNNNMNAEMKVWLQKMVNAVW